MSTNRWSPEQILTRIGVILQASASCSDPVDSNDPLGVGMDLVLSQDAYTDEVTVSGLIIGGGKTMVNKPGSDRKQMSYTGFKCLHYVYPPRN